MFGCANQATKKGGEWSMNDENFLMAMHDYHGASTRYWSRNKEQAKNDMEIAAKRLYPFAKDGNPAAQYLYGGSLVYSNQGRGIGPWMIKSSDSGFLPAKRKLTGFYRTGYGVVKNQDAAIKIIKENVKYGHAQDISVLAALYRIGKGVKKDPKRYYEIMTEAAMLGHSSSHSALAQAYGSGYGEKEDLIKSYAWYEISFMNSYAHYKNMTGNVRIIKKSMSEPDLNKAKNLKEDLADEIALTTSNLIKKAKEGDLISQRVYAYRCFTGDAFVKKDHLEAATWLSIAGGDLKNSQRDYDQYTFAISLNTLTEKDKKLLNDNIKAYHENLVLDNPSN